MNRFALAWHVLMGRPIMYRYELRNVKKFNGDTELMLNPRAVYRGYICECKFDGFDGYSQNLLDAANKQ